MKPPSGFPPMARMDHTSLVDVANKLLLIREAHLWISFKETVWHRINASRMDCVHERWLLGFHYSDTIGAMSDLLGVSRTAAESAVADAVAPSQRSIMAAAR